MPLQVRNTRIRDGEQVWKTLDTYYQTYWSGLDARIYANDIFLDDLVGLQYELQEAVMPLFSYADYTYRGVAHGARRVTGAFSLNYKRENYLFDLLHELEQPRAFPAAQSGDPEDRTFQLAATGNATLEDFVALTSTGNTQKSGKARLDPQLVSRSAAAFRTALWSRGSQLGTPTVPTPTESELARRFSSQHSRFEIGKRFDLRISFGSLRRDVEPGAVRQMSETGTFQNVPFSQQVFTETKLIGVALTGVSRQLDDSGRPVMESYTFIAQDLL